MGTFDYFDRKPYKVGGGGGTTNYYPQFPLLQLKLYSNLLKNHVLKATNQTLLKHKLVND